MDEILVIHVRRLTASIPTGQTSFGYSIDQADMITVETTNRQELVQALSISAAEFGLKVSGNDQQGDIVVRSDTVPVAMMRNIVINTVTSSNTRPEACLNRIDEIVPDRVALPFNIVDAGEERC